MGSLTACSRKFGKAISKDDAAFMKTVRQEHIDNGMDSKEATNKAVNAVLMPLQE